MIRSRKRALAVSLSVTALVVVPATALGVAGDFVEPATSPETAGESPSSVIAANFNGDANLDLAVANQLDSNVSILLGDGTGNFTAAGTETVAGEPSSVVAASFNGDANTDLAVANDTTDNVTILLGDGAGNFMEVAVTSPEAVGDGPAELRAGSFGGDANVDLAVANSNADTVSILHGDGTGNFIPFGTEVTGDVPGSLGTGNFNGDANADLAVANVATDDITILLGDGTGNFSEPMSSPEGAGDAPRAIAVGGLGGSGSPDLAVANSGSDNVTIRLGDGTGNFTAPMTSPEPVGDEPRAVLSVGLTGGATPPGLVVANQVPGTVSVLLSNGTAGDFIAAGTSPETVGADPTSIAAGQFGGDTSTDLAVANADSDDVSILLNDLSTPPVVPPVNPPAATTPGPTGQRAAALKKCKKRRSKPARKRCKKRASKLPI